MGGRSSLFDPNSTVSYSVPKRRTWPTPVDWKETPDAHVFKVASRAFKKVKVKVEVEGKVVQISAEKEEKKDK